jgi:glyoxylate/hydroxypyruvate reductase
MTDEIVVIKCGDHLVPGWVENMSRLLPEFSIEPYWASFDESRVLYVIGWCPDARWVNGFPNLKALVSIGSGVDHIVHLDELRETIPVIRTVSSDLVQRMKEFAVLCVLASHRQLPLMLEGQREREWKRYSADTADQVNVGILGFGSMGQAAAAALSSLGYSVSIWANSARSEVPYPYFFGREQLKTFACDIDVLLCMLPLTAETEGILDYELMTSMRRGGCLVNLGRGGHLIDDDLARALAEGHLSAAFLDAFRNEPLPADSPLWTMPGVYVTCHSAAYISPESGPVIIAENIRRFDAGEPVGPLYDRRKGY